MTTSNHFKKIRPFFIRFIIFAALSASPSVYAEEAMDWKDCVSEAKSQHPDLKSAFEKIQQTKAEKEITRSVMLPQISGNASRNTSQQPSGGSTSSSMVSASSSSSKPSTTYEYDITGEQLVFDAFKSSFDLSASERNVRAAKYDYDVTSSNIRLRLRTAFANLLRSQELVRVTRDIEARRRQNLELVRLRYEGGREHKGSLLTSEADLAKAVYEVRQAERGVYTAERQLTKELGRKSFDPVKAVGKFEVDDPESKMPDFDRLADTTPLLKQLIAKKEAAKFGVKSAYADFFPQVYASASLGNINNKWVPDKNEWSAGLNLSLPIFDGGNKFAVLSQTKAVLGAAEEQERSGRDGVIYTLSQTWALLQDAIDNVGVQKKYLEATEERARISEAEYAIGLLSYDNWIIIEDNLVSAKTNYVNARAAALIAEATWIQAKGGTLEYDKF